MLDFKVRKHMAAEERQACPIGGLVPVGEATVARFGPTGLEPGGIALKHAGTVDEVALTCFLDEHATEMHCPTLRYAVRSTRIGSDISDS
jgi:hypothetical protein